jgi:hypothetical protein
MHEVEADEAREVERLRGLLLALLNQPQHHISD